MIRIIKRGSEYYVNVLHYKPAVFKYSKQTEIHQQGHNKTNALYRFAFVESVYQEPRRVVNKC